MKYPLTFTRESLFLVEFRAKKDDDWVSVLKLFFAIRSQSETHCMMSIYEWGPFSHYYLKPKFSFEEGQNIRIMIVLNLT